MEKMLKEIYETAAVKSTIAAGLGKFMKENNWSLRKVAEAVDVDHKTIWNYQQGVREPSLTVFLRLMKIGVEFKFDWI